MSILLCHPHPRRGYLTEVPSPAEHAKIAAMLCAIGAARQFSGTPIASLRPSQRVAYAGNRGGEG
jgi:hypothetical protein